MDSMKEIKVERQSDEIEQSRFEWAVVVPGPFHPQDESENSRVNGESQEWHQRRPCFAEQRTAKSGFDIADDQQRRQMALFPDTVKHAEQEAVFVAA